MLGSARPPTDHTHPPTHHTHPPSHPPNRPPTDQLDDDLDNGVSNPCATFGNNCLSSSEFFKTLNVELFVLTVETDRAQPEGMSAFEFDNDC